MYKFLPVLAVLGLVLALLLSPRLQNNNLSFLQDNTTPSCAKISELQNADGGFDDNTKLAIFKNNAIDYPKTSLAQLDSVTGAADVLGAKNAQGEEKWIEVSLSEQKLRAWEGNKIVKEYPISSGLWAPTLKGDYAIYWKLRYVRMRGGSKALGTYYDLPNVPYTMFYYQGYGIHGAYWHNNFGHPMSHGCINEPLPEAAWLFDWAGPAIAPDQTSIRATAENPGSRVFIH